MKKLSIIVALIVATMLSTNAFAQKRNSKKAPKYTKLEMNMYPKADAGYKQMYIQLPIAANEDNLKVELYVGAVKEVDCNRYFMAGTISEVNLEGWGYTYYRVESNGEMGGTRMGCPDGKTTSKFIHLQPQLIRYNSKLPIVVYLPENMEVRYKIWRADKKMDKAKGSN